MKTVGSKLEVWRGTAKHTSGRLTKRDLMKNKRGKIVSKKKHYGGKRAFVRNGLQPKNREEMAEMRTNRH